MFIGAHLVGTTLTIIIKLNSVILINIVDVIIYITSFILKLINY